MKVTTVLKRSLSLLLLSSFFLLIVSGTLASKPGQAVVAVLSFVLIVECWFAQRPHVRTRSRLVLLGLALTAPALGSLWLGLNVIRFYSYRAESSASLYTTIVRTQTIVADVAITISVVTLQWSIAELASVIGKAISHKLVGKKTTWWNRPLTGNWRLGIYVGYLVGVLIAFTFLRWVFFLVATLGIVFALIFRAMRDEDQI